MENGDITKFDLKLVHDKFSAALIEDDDIDIELYLESFQELDKFFNLVGSMFRFVSNDLKEKSNHLKELKYKTVKMMIQHEKENNLLNKKGYVSGSRTLLRIHRGLDFIRLFLKKLSELEDQETTSKACKEAYDLTLTHHHSFLVRTSAHLAMYTLPTRGELLQRVCGKEEDVKQTLEILPNTLIATSVVYTRIDTLYSLHDLHNLP
ncbi:ceramide-1-phosphate transfer protein [Cylas formicarius]|uniref:ceramide-1-phosphate transfer protein n=1 Tax=Cylas formicarius TaxID=197179 RepID=UPI0029585985|nr:ceramide-1-phosphate transfer protein [Cylas formicarius]XP_060518526.1 ceramide-1-phosphate transfer protein [Cylas formicarius]